jgi:exodeoxyribonuclease V alpha subunit
MPIETRETTLLEINQKPKHKDWGYAKRTSSGIAWKGKMGLNLTPGTWLRAEGEQRKEGGFPTAFNVTKVLEIVRSQEDFGKAWMVWRLPQIGDVRAETLSKRFGDKLPDAFESSDAAQRALAAMQGLTPARVKAIMAAYTEFPGELRMVLWLGGKNGKGLSWGAIRVAIEHFSSTSRLSATASADPYALMIVDDITFTACDLLAEGMGIADNDPRRLRGMIWSKLEELAGKGGDCVLRREDVLQKLKEFGYRPAELEQILNESEHYEFLGPGLQLVRILNAEQSVASRVKTLLRNAKPAKPQTELRLKDLPKWLDDSQVAAVENLMQVPIAILTGGPGTGKTTVLKAALDQMERRGERIKLASPTGKAAKRMTESTGRPAQTIHKLLDWRPEGWKRGPDNPIEADVVVVDEASMLDIELAKGLFEALSNRTRLILVGDVDQLPPVGPGALLYDLMRSGMVPTFRLTEIHRQGKDSWVIENAARILQGRMPSLAQTSDFLFVRAPEARSRNDADEARTSLYIVQHIIGMYRQARAEGPDAEKQLQVLTPQHNAGAGTQRLNTEIQKALNPKASDSRFDDQSVAVGDSKIFAGDKVFYTKNNADIGLVNGSMGVVEEIRITADGPEATVRFDGETSPETGTDLFVLQGPDVKPLQLAYAMTVHKAQGSEWSNVVFVADPSHWLRRKLMYTAITRTNAMLTIVGTESAVGRGAKNVDKDRDTLLVERLRGEPM